MALQDLHVGSPDLELKSDHVNKLKYMEKNLKLHLRLEGPGSAMHFFLFCVKQTLKTLLMYFFGG